ncbi:hypothetical protein GOBAR_DD02787 [Gossypium barbadense]|nr:hypothetical protein GOBAR_DD02787 [Gossypium barbadense]
MSMPVKGKGKTDHRFDNVDHALSLFNKMIEKYPKPSIVESTKLFSAIVRMKHYAIVVSMCSQMELLGVSHDVYFLVVERMLASEGIKRVELGRDEFEKRVWEWKENKIDMTTTVLGFKISMPIMIAPTAMQKMAHPEDIASILTYDVHGLCHRSQTNQLKFHCLLSCFTLIPHLRPAKYKRSRLPRNRRTVNRAYGGFEEGFEDSENQGKGFIKEPVQLIKDSL